MSFMPVFELGLWNAWIFILSYLLMLVVFSAFDRQKGSSRPMTPPLNEKEKKIDRIALLIFLASVAYSFFLPLKLGTVWLYFGLLVYLFGMVFAIVAAANLINTPTNSPATKGLYRISRNPIYLGTFLIFISVGITCASWLFLLLIAVFMVLQDILIAPEERWCLEKYGDAYREYMNRTPRWIGIPKTPIKTGLISLGVGFLLLVVLIALSLLFVIGTAPGVKTPLSSPLRELVSCLFTLGMYWFVFVVVGVVLIVYGLIQRIRDNKMDTTT